MGARVRALRLPASLSTGQYIHSVGIVAKAVLWRDLPDWVLTCGADSGGQRFPNDKISDQWFDEAQFVAYTEVGRRTATRALQLDPYPSAATVPPRPDAQSEAVGVGV
jgi:hypothetical protein